MTLRLKKLWLIWTTLLCLCVTGIALADNGFTVKRFPEDFTVGEVTHQPRPALFSLSGEEEGPFPSDLLYGDAVEQGLIPPADADRLKATAQKGLKAEINISTGLIEVDIDMANSNWTEVMANGDLHPKVMVRHTLDRPDTMYETHAGFSGGFDDRSMGYILTLMEETGMHWDGGNIQAGNGEMIAEIIPAQSLLSVKDRVMTSNHFIAWMDADTREVYYEHYKMIVTLSDTQNRYVPFRYVSESMLKPTETAALPSGVTVKEIKDGDVTFKVTGGGDNYDAPIVLEAPEGAAAVEIYRHGSVRPSTFANGKATFIFSFNGTDTHESQYNVKWYNSANEIIEYGILLCHAEPEDYGPWPSYSTAWAKPDSDRVVLLNGCTDIGVTLTYDNEKSVAHIGYDKDADVTGDVGTVYVLLEAPEGATHFRMNESGANDIMGEDENEVQTQLSFTREQELQQVPESGFLKLVDRAPLRKIEADPLEVFVQIGEGEVWPYSGSVFTVFWYESEEDALLNPGAPAVKEYVALTTGSMCTTNRVPVVENEAEITKPVEEVTAVGEEYNSQGWRLVVKRYPFKGREGFHYELTLENRYGVYQPLNSTMVFYMPYPNDYFSHPDNYTFSLRHFESDYSDYDLVSVEEREYGVRFEIASLSPFLLSWNNEGQPGGGSADDDAYEGIVLTSQGALESLGRMDKAVIVVDPALITANGPLRLLYSKTDDAENQVNYNLRLVNENGAAVTFSEAHLCLPYPSDMDEETSVGMAPVVTHEAGSGNEVFTIEDNTLGHPVQGLCMDIDSLDLYEVAWQGGGSGNPPADDWNSGVIVASVNEINGPVEHPTIVLSDDFVQANDAQFVYREAGRDFDRVTYEIRLMDERGSDVDLPGETTLYLPYPEEMSADNYEELKASVTHEGADGALIYSIENGSLAGEAQGLRMEVASLGLFEIAWEEEAPDPGPSWEDGFILAEAAELAAIGHLDRPAILLNREYKETCRLLFSILDDRYNGRVYEIRLVDGNGSDVDLPGEATLYLPYAEWVGMDKNNCEEMGMAIGQVVGDPPELQTLPYTPAEEGLGVAVSTLGTFEMSWEA
ncbi:MAG: hypothetical protein IJF65_04010, partial [Clostridia bacterium]|nr:hypothetical protein [Clostridia bacterium]